MRVSDVLKKKKKQNKEKKLRILLGEGQEKCHETVAEGRHAPKLD